MPKEYAGPNLQPDPKTGIFYVHWLDGRRTKRASTGTRDRTAATRFLAQFIMEGEKVEREDLKAAAETGGLTVGEVLDFYIQKHINKPGEVVDQRRELHAANRCLRPFFGAMYPKQIDDDCLADYAEARALSERGGGVGPGKAKSNGTIIRELNTLIAAINFAVAKDILPVAAVRKIEKPKKPGAREFWLREEETPQLIEAARQWGNERGFLFIAIATYTASRRRAIETLRWDQIDLDAGMIYFNPPGREQTNKRRANVPIDTALRAVLETVPVLKRRGHVLGHAGEITSIFESIRRHAAKLYDNPRFLKVSPHTLRHTWATQAARRGVTLYKIAGVLGDSMATVERNYLKWCPDHLRDAFTNTVPGEAANDTGAKVIPWRKRA
jgi:integrase